MLLENEFNILNYAIEYESIHIVLQLEALTENFPKVREKLLEHKFGKDRISAIHQVITYGNKTMLHLLVNNFNADLGIVTS